MALAAAEAEGGAAAQFAGVQHNVDRVPAGTGLTVEPRRLLYIAQVVSRYTLQDVNFVFEATITERGEGEFQLIPLDNGDHILPPILDRIATDATDDWPEAPYWLGNIYREPARAGEQ